MATATLRQGTYVDQYKIDDLGGEYDNYLVIISHQVNEVLIQVSSVNFHTQKEALLCWDDPYIIECPEDDIGGGVYRMPILVLLDSIMAAGGVTVGADLSDARQKSIYLGFWHEYRTHKLVVEDSIDQMILDGLNATQQRRALKFIYFGSGIDIDTAQALANNRITNGVSATYDEYGLSTIPLQDRRLLKLFGEVGWFE